jgi:WXG100 family type VII secretion target
MPAFSVDLPALLAAADQMSSFNARLEQSLARVKSSMARLDPLWRGDASAAQQSAQQQWDSGAEELRAALGQLRDIAEKAHGNYSDAAAMNTRMWS